MGRLTASALFVVAAATFATVEAKTTDSLLDSMMLLQQEDASRYLQEDESVCVATSCCIDCVCCGPGTEWNGVECVLGSAPAICDAQTAIENDGCFSEWSCLGEACCGEGTQSVVDPNRPAIACYCVPDDGELTIQPTESPTGSPTAFPTELPTSTPTGEPCVFSMTLTCSDTETGVSCGDIVSNGEDCLRDVEFYIELCDESQGITFISDATLTLSQGGSEEVIALEASGGEDFLFGGLCLTLFQQTATLDICGSDVVAIAAANGQRDNGQGEGGPCSDSDAIQFSFTAPPMQTVEPTESPKASPTGLPTGAPTNTPCMFSMTLTCSDTETGVSCGDIVSNGEDCLRDVEFYIELCDESQGITFISDATLTLSQGGSEEVIALEASGGEDFLFGGLCLTLFQQTATLDICGSDVVATAAANGKKDCPFFCPPCFDSDTIQLSFAS